MAPALSKIAPPLTTQPETQITGPQKRKASSKITDENFVGVESNVITKRLKQSADTARAMAEKRRQRLSSVEDVEDEDNTPRNNPPKNPRALLEAADRSDNVEPLDNNPAPISEESEEDEDDESEIMEIEHVESAEAQHRKSNKLS
jgi:hypothetical protein